MSPDKLLDTPGAAASPEATLGDHAEMVVQIDENGSLVIIHTTAGAARTVALAIGRAGLPQVLGTIAGDDTIFLAPPRNTATAGLARHLKKVFQRGGTP